MIQQCFCAPMEGITAWRFRHAHQRWFGGVERYYMPFISPDQNHLFTPQEKREILPEHNEGLNVVPQILTKSVDDFLWCSRELGTMGYKEVDLNLGCPSGTVAAKGKGSGFLGKHHQELDHFLEEIFSKASVRISVKTRLGLEDPEEFWPILEIYNKYPMTQLTIHTRVRKDFYKLPARKELFGRYLPHCKMPVCYNGDLFTPEQGNRLAEQVPELDRVMLGRGLAADPALTRKLRGGPSATREELRAFHDELFDGYREDFGSERNAIFRMLELWTCMLRLFADHDKHAKWLRKAKRRPDYDEAVNSVFRELELLPHARW